jgi:hypothetical protein
MNSARYLSDVRKNFSPVKRRGDNSIYDSSLQCYFDYLLSFEGPIDATLRVGNQKPAQQVLVDNVSVLADQSAMRESGRIYTLRKGAALSRELKYRGKLRSLIRRCDAPTNIRYYYRFVTIVPLSASEGAQLFDVRMRHHEYEKRGAHNKLLVKQSYLLLT